MVLDAPALGAAGAAALLAGAVNAIAGGGTLISFPALVALGVPAVKANVTNTVSLLSGYLAGSYAQRNDLGPQLAGARLLAGVAAAGGLTGSVLLVLLPAHAFGVTIPYLILLACGLLAFGDRLRPPGAGPTRAGGPVIDLAAGAVVDPAGRTVADAAGGAGRRATLLVSIFLGAAYGGFFGAGLSIIVLALLGIFRPEPLTQLNALKQALSFVINLVAAGFFCFSGRVVWSLVPVMATASLAGGYLGGRAVTRIDPRVLRGATVLAGVAVAVTFWVT